MNTFPRDREHLGAMRGAVFTIMERVFTIVASGGGRLEIDRRANLGGFCPQERGPNERISMSKLKQLIGLQSSNLGVRALARALDLSVGAVSKYLRAVRACGIEAAEADTLSEYELERRVFGPTLTAKAMKVVAPDCAWIHGELKRHRHVTLAAAVGGIRRAAWRRAPTDAAPSARSTALGEAPEALDAPAPLRRREALSSITPAVRCRF